MEILCEGVTDGPVATDIYKRAVCRPAPSKFTVEMLGSAKKGSSTCYGIRIWPTLSIASDRSSLTSSTSAGIEYEVWRRWEDCLQFQGTLELEYKRMARVKRQRLIRGKGVKKNGLYLQDQASSWESLPPGPDPNSVAKDIHEYLPSLTKKGTVFRTSQSTIDQRAREFAKLVEALMRDDVPALVDELRNNRVISDFFGVWRRDLDLLEKTKQQRKADRERDRSSVTSSLFSMYFPASNHSTSELGSGYARSVASSHSSQSSSPTIRGHRRPQPSIVETVRSRRSSSDSSEGTLSLRSGRPRAHSTASSTSSPSTASDTSLDSPRESSIDIPEIREEAAPLAFNYDPRHHRSEARGLSVLPEDRELSWKGQEMLKTPPVTRRRGKSLNGEPGPPAFLTAPQPTRQPSLPERHVRESWQTVDSVACMLEGMDLTLSTPRLPNGQLHRASVASVATFRTDCSADGVLPRSEYNEPPSPTHSLRSSKGRGRVTSFPVSVSEFDEEWPAEPEEGVDEILDAFFADSFPSPCNNVPQDVIHDYPRSASQFTDDQSTPHHPRAPVSPAKSSTFSVSTVNSSLPQHLNIKVGCNDSFIAIRAPCDISYKDLRQRVYNKFVGVEGVPLSDKFLLSFVQHLTYSAADSSTDHEEYTLYPITSEGDWETVTASIEGTKLTLRVTDKP